MNTFAFTFLILLLGSKQESLSQYSEYDVYDYGGLKSFGKGVQAACNSKDREHVVSIILLTAESTVQRRCGGSLMNWKWSLTVAQCIRGVFGSYLQRAGRPRSLSQVYVRAGFDRKTNSFRQRPVKRYVDLKTQRVLVNMKGSLSLVELERPFEPLPNLKPYVIPKDPVKQLQSCRGAETVSIVPVPKPPVEIPTTTPLAPSSTKEPVESNNSTEYIMERICRSAKIVEECGREWDDLTPETATSKPSTEPYQICGMTKVPGQSENHTIIEAENETKSEFHKPISNMSSCVNSIGSPLICNGVLIAIVNRCHRGGARGDIAMTTFTSVEPYLDIIAETIKDPSIKNNKKKIENKEATTEKSTTSGADIFKGDGGKVLAGIGIFFCFFVRMQ